MQPEGDKTLTSGIVRPRLSIPRRVFLAFSLVLTVSGVVSVASFVQHQNTAATLRLLHEGYLPLSLTISEARALQSASDTLLERVMSERDTASTRRWLSTAQARRPAIVEQALRDVDQIEQLAPPAKDRAATARLRRELRRARADLELGAKDYEELFRLIRDNERANADTVLADLRARERSIDRRLRSAWDQVLGRIKTTSELAAQQEREAIVVLGALVCVALLVGVAVTWWSQRVLSPLPRLHERVAAVARGDFVHRLGPTTDDEIGQLAREFERMVSALSARDQSLRDAADRLLQSERLAAIGRMAAHVTHEVRNPLSSIALNVELLEEELSTTSAETRALLSAIQREVKRLTVTTEEYLGVARAPKPTLQAEDIGELTRDAVQFTRPEMQSCGVSLDLQIESNLPLVALDDSQYRQVLLNLLKNAREAMPEGGAIALQLLSHDNGVQLRVSDTGSGMDRETQARLFDLFYTTKKRGTGLGLPLTQQIVIAHGGRIACTSEQGKGTTFELWFPIAGSSSNTDATDPQSTAGGAETSGTQHT